jgi:hypothetical protein
MDQQLAVGESFLQLAEFKIPLIPRYLGVLWRLSELLPGIGRSSCMERNGVTDGTRTRDNQNHNLGLYQLSYDHQSEGREK